MALRRHHESVFGWSRFQADRGFDFNGTAIQGSDGTVLLVDPVPATDEEKAALGALGRRFEIVLLNAHHERDAAAFAEWFEAPVNVAAPDLAALKLTGARPFHDGATFAGGWQTRILPAMKTPGEAVLFHPDLKLLVVGDAVIADPVTGLRLPPPKMLPNPGPALDTLEKLLALDFDGMLIGDGFVLPTGGREALRRFLQKEGRHV